MSKFQPPMLNDDVCRAATDKQTHKHTYKHTYWVKTEDTFFTAKFFIFYFSFSNSLKVKKTVSKKFDDLYRLTVRKRFKISMYCFRYWNGTCFSIYMSKYHDYLIIGHFIVRGNLKVVNSENTHLFTGCHCYIPNFSRLLLKKWLYNQL